MKDHPSSKTTICVNDIYICVARVVRVRERERGLECLIGYALVVIKE